ncbi:uncharacterized protein I303_108146 [Kwoniella dejecticola CBS 10117]|uniref:Regucalcin n=1 Tax=Kwoniella dejecticola CBS 10117 TaxID=1296121 RepID=A0A1A5ZY71_9TREE|nr:regucalcin [Kwoniella dejecticola CBS 10117]OBR82761.1 regucalcin [Kwoniella dejecticola CBS 10117]
MVKHITVNEPLLSLNCTLGEGAVWDTRLQRLFFVDIDQRKVYTYEPGSGQHGYQTFDQKITSLSGLQDGSGLIAAIDTGFAYIPFSSLPFPPDGSKRSIIPINVTAKCNEKEKRFNEGTVDPAGRFLSGTLGFEHGSKDGRMFALEYQNDGSHAAPLILDSITCTNGMGWTADGKTMYFTDSWIKEIAKFDYDLSTGKMSNRTTFSILPDEFGEPDGMCTDAQGGIWSARWAAGKVVRLTPAGEIDVVIDFPKAWHMTCCVFGGPDLEDLYVTSAASDYIGDDLPDRSDGGALFVVKGVGYRGVERNRFKGSLGSFSK